MKRYLLLLPLLALSVFLLTGCNSSDIEEKDATIAQLESELSQAVERSNLLAAEIREQEEVEVTEQPIELKEENAEGANLVAKATRSNLTFGSQPTEAPGEYSANTRVLNTYAHNNMVGLSVPAGATTMTINLKKAVEENGRNIIVYVETKGRYCGGRILGAELGEVKGNAFTFDLNNMAAYPTVCGGDWSNKISGKDILIGGYVTTFDGNGFSSITFN